MATRGHVRDLPAKAGWVKPEDGFAMVYETGRGAARTPGAMAKALRRADALVLATDLDREGEAIAWQACAAALDYLVGYGPLAGSLAPAAGLPVGGAGAVGGASPHLRGEAEIEAFAPRAYWTVTADATATDGATLASGGTSGSGAPFRVELCRLDGAAIDVAGP